MTLEILGVMIAVILGVAFLTLAERKVIGWMQIRIGPNQIRIFGLPVLKGVAQPFADVIKLLLKEIIVPANADTLVFLIAPLIALVPSLSTWAVIPWSPEFVLADIDAGLLYILALTSLGVYGIILAGWASNSKYALLGAMRSAAQIVAYEIAMGFALVGVLMAAGSLNLTDIVRAPGGRDRPLERSAAVPAAGRSTSSPASPRPTARRSTSPRASRRSPRVSTSSTRARLSRRCSRSPEYANMILVATLASVLFLGGWLSPFDGYRAADLAARRSRRSSGCSSRSSGSCSASCGSGRPSRATATTRSCGSAGRCSSR